MQNTRQLLRDFLSRRDIKLFRALDANRQGFALLNLTKYNRKRILNKLKSHEILNLLHYVDPDDATDLLQSLSNIRRKKIIQKLDIHKKEKVEFLLRFNPNTAAGIMSLDYIQISKGMKFDKVFVLIKKHEIRTGKTPAILVVEHGYLIGKIPWRLIIHCKEKQKVDSYIRKCPTIRFDKDEDDIVKCFKANPHNNIVVLDEDNSILGVIYSDDVLRIIEEPTGDLYDFAGVRDEENVNDSALTKVKYRYKWLIINLFTVFLAAYVVSLFQDTISSFVLLAVYMPVVAGMGGNAGTQTLAVVVRGLTLKEIDPKSGKKIILKEMAAGAINGTIVGVLVAIIATLWNHNPLLGIAIGSSMVINLMIAGLFGSTIPLIMKYLRKDPATSATIFITTATDICGFFIFLTLATMLL
jgi:magnesium transporter